MRQSYRELLRESLSASGSLYCLGVDPILERFPKELRRHENHRDISTTVDLLAAALDALSAKGLAPGAVKPNIGYFARHDRPFAGEFAGSRALASVIELVRSRLPGTPIILDSKRGDIARSSDNYAAEAFDVWQADAVTASPLMGEDSVGPFADAAGRHAGCVYLLARTSNPGAKRFQNLTVEGRPFYVRLTEAIRGWATDRGTPETDPGSRDPGAVGAVVGATAPEELSAIAESLVDTPIPLLIPGVGSQGGSAPRILSILRRARYPLELVRVNVSSGSLFPWGNSPPPKEWRSAINTSVVGHHRDLAPEDA